MKKTFDVALVVSVEAESLEKAEDYVHANASLHLERQRGILQVALAECDEDNYHQRVFYLHPRDVDNEYDAEEYQARLDAEDYSKELVPLGRG